MKTIVKICLVFSMILFGFGYAYAQSAASSSKNVVQMDTTTHNMPIQSNEESIDSIDFYTYRMKNDIPLPTDIQDLLRAGKATEAVSAYENFKAKLQKEKVNPFSLLHSECGFWGWVKSIAPNDTKLAQKFEDLKKEMVEKFPNEPDVYIIQIDETTSNEKIVELTTKILELDSKNTFAYEQRSQALYNLGQTKEACQDLNKLPNSLRKMSPIYWTCQNLTE